ncbi:hypothetical protein, partial [Brevibacillus massiliensis]|uniref:hypothetical protein n=1 Tax=Brevibacillus massiliensis TaxID=1118054 RepID=UPI0005505F0A
ETAYPTRNKLVDTLSVFFLSSFHMGLHATFCYLQQPGRLIEREAHSMRQNITLTLSLCEAGKGVLYLSTMIFY